jgi:hypothetical protein
MGTRIAPVRVAGIVLAALAGLAGGASRATAQTECSGPGFGALDFWLGDWDVFVGDQRVGSDRVYSILDGCAVIEEWTDAAGSEGRSLFWVQPAGGGWRQVWVTDRATLPGGTKEKAMTATPPGGGVRFQGEIPLEGGGSYLDRTTLTPLGGGRVRQLIEISTDGGATWEARFDAVYVPR